jgi:hypothetical protein
MVVQNAAARPIKVGKWIRVKRWLAVAVPRRALKSFYRASIFIDGIAKVNVVFSGVEFTLRIPPWALAISDAI